MCDSGLYVDSSLEVPGERGCFTSCRYERGSIIERISLEDALPHLIHIDEYLLLSNDDEAKYGYRYAGDMILYRRNERIVSDYMNHSKNCNVVIYLGYTIALRAIRSGEEILADYRFLMHEKFKMDCGSYCVEGLPAREAELEFLRICTDLGVRS